MKTFVLRGSLLALALAWFCDARSQNPVQPYVRIGLIQATGTDYAEIESTIWKPLHQMRVDRDEILSWNFFWVNYGDRSGHDHAIATFYPDLKAVQADWTTFEADFAEAHPNAEMEKVLPHTWASRRVVRYELWREVMREGPWRPFQRAAISYMKVPAGGGDEYLALERDWWAPIHRSAIEKGCQGAWAVYDLQQPWGTGVPYNFAAVQFADEWTMDCDFVEIAAEVHPDTEWTTISEATGAARELVNGVEWTLIDSTTRSRSED